MLLLQTLMEDNLPTYQFIEWVSIAIELLAVSWIFFGVFSSTARYFYRIIKKKPPMLVRYTEYRHTLARTLMLGLELLVAGDVIHTVALEATFESVGVLGLLVLIRIVLGWSLVVEIEGRWPWQPERTPEGSDPDNKF
ncbi:DUF1622 domain-containing protein [Chloroflexota bacterium]